MLYISETSLTMPGFPVATCETSYSRNTNQISYPDAHGHLSAEEELAAEESFAVYCKPVEFYNILRRRALRNPTFLQRCLEYKIKARQKKRIQLTALLSDTDETQVSFPLYICLARLASKDEDAERYSAEYRIGRVFILRDPSEVDGDTGDTHLKANFLLPDIHRLALTAKSGSLVLLFFTAVEDPNSSSGVNASLMPLDPSSSESRDGQYCLCGKVSLEKIFQSWDESPNLRLGLQAEAVSTVDLHPCFLKYGVRYKEQSISVQVSNNFENGFLKSTSKQLQIKMYAQQCGAKEKSSHYTNVTALASASLSRIIRLKEGNVKFNYRYYYDKLQRTEVTEDFSCPLCLVRCASYKGIKYHLLASHDLLNYEFSAWEDCPTINVSVKTDNWKSEIFANIVDPKLYTINFCLSQLSKRKFYHSHKYQPMELEEVLSEEDSEDEVDDEVASFEDRRMLGNFVDVTEAEKKFMHMWNSFVRKQRVLADGHIPWACEAFVKVHGFELLECPILPWCWRLFSIKLWNHGLLDARTINLCSLILQQYQREKPAPNS
ncbi:polycomb group protein EMBRYONIC FLOWER 2 isoform X3 [Arachis ipaensis]|uniref:polycomb group protein EMBRYONIC FLOWER 2 isoform X3 n=1 Tax=Arachis ipaensis TaxID=130454 RepID=UPI000A2B795F|nr:polycomb group protein EMBRYONIC FLOWER 2 isoform X3 [Arachis ipaensis]XP_025632385.1 polycomb group protein EMBRYONIC FLOWER 2 isoform X3 [Arachis hypogaea]